MMQCPTCGAREGSWRRPCGNCGERATLRALGRLAFADDPDAPPRNRPPRPTELAAPRARLAAAGIDVALAFLALLWSGAIGTDQAFSHPVSGSRAKIVVLQRLSPLRWFAFQGLGLAVP